MFASVRGWKAAGAVSTVVALLAAFASASLASMPGTRVVGQPRPMASALLTPSDEPDPRIVSAIWKLLEKRAPDEALKMIDRWYPNWSTNTTLRGLRANAHDQLLAACSDELCRFVQAGNANRAVTTSARALAALDAKEALKKKLVFELVPDEPLPELLRRARRFKSLAGQASTVTANAPDVHALVTQELAIVQSELIKVPLIGATEDVVTQILGDLTVQSPTVSYRAVEDILVFAVFDARRKCRGLYAVGAQKNARTIEDEGWSPEAFLAQSIGRAGATLKRPTSITKNITKWQEGRVGVVARWRDGTLLELRVGDAAP